MRFVRFALWKGAGKWCWKGFMWSVQPVWLRWLSSREAAAFHPRLVLEGGRGRQGNWQPSCGIWPTVISERRCQHSLSQGWAIKGGHFLLDERETCPHVFGNLHILLLLLHGMGLAGLAALPGDKEGEKRSFLKKSSIPFAALISISKPVSGAMMHSVRRLNVPSPPPLSVREKMNVSSAIGVPGDAGL